MIDLPMNREYHKWHSPSLGRDMELLVFGHSGLPIVVFPTSMGRFFDYENRDMIGVIGDQYGKRTDPRRSASIRWMRRVGRTGPFSIRRCARATAWRQYDEYLLK